MAHPPEHDRLEDHDRGLTFDLARMLDRRRALGLLGGVGIATALGACSSSGSDDASKQTSTTRDSAGELPDEPTGAIPAETAGPFPADGTNGPNVLDRDGVIRQDIRPSFAGMDGTAGGIPLRVRLTVTSAAGGTALAGAAVYIWHCDREGRYSLYDDGVTERNYLRGVQVADSSGLVTFTSVFPGCYEGRWPHIHIEVFESEEAATGGGEPAHVTQLAFPEGASREAYLTGGGYEQSLTNLSSLSLDTDMVFQDGYDKEMATVNGDPEAGYVAILAVPI